MPMTTQMLLSPPNDFLFFLPQTKPKPLLHPHVFTIFPKPLFKVPSLLPNHPLCLSTSTTEALPQSAIERIAQKLRSLGYVEEVKESYDLSLSFTKGSSPGQIFVPIPTHLPKHRVGSSLDPSWSTPENPVPEPGSGTGIQRFHELRRTVKKERIEEKSKVKEILPTLAELTLPKGELRRLRTIGIGLEKSLKVGKAGITEGIVNGIHERWRRNEVIKIVCEDICRMNMKRTHDLLERKTGGLVVWRSGSKIVLYRGVDYKYPYFIANDDIMDDISNEASPDQLEDRGTDEGSSSDNIAGEMDLLSSERNLSRASLIQGVGVPNRVRFQLPGEAQIAQEADSMLDGLGPRFNDWWGYEPLPVDADLLPAVVPGYRRPFRMLPYGVKPKLTNDEMSVLKRLGRPLPCHFALGRNRKLQGLAVAILKLWEKCEIAKIAVKRGVQNTNSSLMAEELKKLTGGILLSRDKHFIVLYRGKDFLPAAVSSAIEARRKQRLVSKEKGTEQNSYVVPNATENEQWVPEDSLESENLGDMDLNTHHDVEERKLRFEEAAIERPNVKLDHDVEEKKLRSEEAAIERTTVKLSEALAKKEKAEKLLAELDSEVVSQQPEIDKEGLTKEERYMLRRVGMRMKPFLLMGRRGVFAGTIENMHLHWKYRELVKIICGAKSVKEALDVARTLEAESGGILIAVERVSKGYAIIVYRGKNYTRPASLRPDTLLTKREAMKRSIEAQRRKSLQLHVLKLAHNIDDLKLRLDKDTDRNGKLLSEDLCPEMVPSCTGYIKTQADLGIEVKSQVEEHETDTVQSAENKMDVTSSEALSQATSCTIFTEQVKNETRIARDLLEDDYTPESEPPSKPPSNGSENTSNTNESKTTSFPDFFEKCSQRSSSDIIDTLPQNLDIRTVGFTESKQTELRLSVDRVSKDKYQTLPCRVSRLSNKERLQLRKQALMVKRRPLFSIGKSNVVEGVAKALKSHFKKHPLAIVNVKGRAKGTSVQEVVVKLEEATGALFVSEEPSKVILYRGWGAEEEVNNNTSRTEKRNRRSTGTYTNAEENREDQKRYIASPELISAIKLECGLLHSASTS